MYKLNFHGKNIYVEDAKSSQLGTVFGWYNMSCDYYYATGKEKPITMKELWKKYQEYVESPDVFFSLIFRNTDNEPLGLIKGSILKEKKNSLWISVLFILTMYQKLGYGTETIFSFFNKIKVEKDIKTLYLSCCRHNVKGLKFWHKMGFVPSEIILGNMHEKRDLRDIILMTKEI